MMQLSGIDFGYNRKLLFRNLSLSLLNGHIYGLLGKNGAGKTTLLKNMVGLAFPRRGFAALNGESTSERKPAVLQNIYFMAEEIYVPPLTARQFFRKTAGFYPRFDREEYYRNLEIFEVDPDIPMEKLSYGQQKKAMISFALATNTDLLVMDEPSNGLDIPSKIQFRKIIASSLTEHRIIIISTHQVQDLDNLIDSVIVLQDGKIALSANIDSISERLSFEVLHEDDTTDVLYQEEGVNGRRVILPNASQYHSKVNLELLFNAIMQNTPGISDKLNQV